MLNIKQYCLHFKKQIFIFIPISFTSITLAYERVIYI